MKVFHSLALASLLPLGAQSFAQGDPATIDRIIDQGKNRSQVMRRLDELTHRVGPRLTSSPGLAKAQAWAMAEFRRYGLRNVRLEKWGEVPVGFERGPRQIARMVSPYRQNLVFTTMNWTPGTNGLTRGRAVMMPATMEEFERVKGSLRGAWVLMRHPSTMRGPVPVPPPVIPPGLDPASAAAALRAAEAGEPYYAQVALREAVDAAGILGRVYGANDERVHSSGNWRGKSYTERPRDIAIIVRRSDFDRVSKAAQYGKAPTVLEFDIENRWIKGPVPQYNVVADLPGTEKPDEMVIVCGHLDSWNSPGSQGACDNGTGSVTAVEAARILTSARARPKRTIRFILWSGEEQGLLGSRAYVESHMAEMDKISAVLNDDGGTNYQGGYRGVPKMRAMMEAAFAPTQRAFPGLPMKFDAVAPAKEGEEPMMPQGGSSDHAPFNWQGVPGFFTMETGRADYGFVWHTQHDRYEYAIPEYLVQSATNHGIVSYNLACAESLLPRPPKPAPRRSALRLPEHPVGADHWYEDPRTHDHDHEDDYTLEVIDRVWRLMRQIAGGLLGGPQGL